MLSWHEPAEFTGVEKRDYSQPVSDPGSPVWKTAKSLPLGIQGVLVKLFPLLTEFDLQDKCHCCARSKRHSPCGEVCADDQEAPQLFPRGQGCPVAASMLHVLPLSPSEFPGSSESPCGILLL